MKIKIVVKKGSSTDVLNLDGNRDKNNSKSFIEEIEAFSKYLPCKSVNEFNYVDSIGITRSIQSYKISNDYKNRKMVVETESIQITAKVCSLLHHYDIRYKIKVSKEFSFSVDLVEIYEKDAPMKLITKKKYM